MRARFDLERPQVPFDSMPRTHFMALIKCYLLSWQVGEAGFPVAGCRAHAVRSKKQRGGFDPIGRKPEGKKKKKKKGDKKTSK